MTSLLKSSGALISALLLAGCVAGPSGQSASTGKAPAATPVAMTEKVAAECGLYEAAMAKDAARTGVQNTQIVIGCPGYENVKDTNTRFSGAGSFLGAASAKAPQAALDMGPKGKLFYRKMIARGVPADVATAMVSDPAFARVVAAYS